MFGVLGVVVVGDKTHDSWLGERYARRDSNPRPSVPKTDALSTELQAHLK